ncbi:hypothetical protein [Crossiella sp. CA198]|uniref:hypothetical protein n=1 Tax=Crossiella sp. CA198 TaxID=3455607 RepID=UPI003F8D61D4
MGGNFQLRRACAVLVVTGVGFAALPVLAHSAPAPPGRSAPSSASVPPRTPQRVAADRNAVQRFARGDARTAVRVAAWAAWISDDGDAAIVEFLYLGGLDWAIERAGQDGQRHLDFINRALETYPAAHFPELHAAAKSALDNNSAAERAWFVRTGFAEARARDQRAREQQGPPDRITAADRDFVRLLAQRDPGPQVRAAAAYAVREGSTDADLTEFLGYDWAAAAALDQATHRGTVNDRDAAWRRTLNQLLLEAQAAEQAELGLSGALLEQAKAATRRAWRSTGEHANTAGSNWLTEHQRAADQARNWQAVAAHAAGLLNRPSWAALGDQAERNHAAWLAEQGWAEEQARFWRATADEAKAKENAKGSGS